MEKNNGESMNGKRGFFNKSIFLILTLFLAINPFAYSATCIACPGSSNQCWVCGEPPVCPSLPEIKINVPLYQNTYPTPKVFYNVTLSEKVQSLVIIVNGATTYSQTICTDCNSFSGNTSDLKSGNYQLCFKAVTYPKGPCQGGSSYSFTNTVCTNFYVTNQTIPKILSYSPKNMETITNPIFVLNYNSSVYNSSSQFNITLLYKQINETSFSTLKRTDCPIGQNVSCSFNPSINASSNLKFYFKIDDYRGFSIRTEEAEVFYQKKLLKINITSPNNSTIYNGTVLLNVSVNETVSYLDYSLDENPFVNLCTNCNSKIMNMTVGNGAHELVIRAYKNYEYTYASANFRADSMPPFIISISPSNNSIISSNFTIQFSDENPRAVVFYWRIRGVDDDFLGTEFNCNFNETTCSKSINTNYMLFYNTTAPIEYYFRVFDIFRNTTSSVYTSTINAQ
jgi:5-hydroxyisourate hydrolase-like protein (transthyretin family)